MSFFFSSRRRHTRCALVTGVQTCALPIYVMDSVNDAMRHATLLPQSAKGTIRLAATYTVLGYFLPDLLSRFKRSYPQVEIDLVDKIGRASCRERVCQYV